MICSANALDTSVQWPLSQPLESIELPAIDMTSSMVLHLCITMKSSILLNVVISWPPIFVDPLHQQMGFEFNLAAFAEFFIHATAFSAVVVLACHWLDFAYECQRRMDPYRRTSEAVSSPSMDRGTGPAWTDRRRVEAARMTERMEKDFIVNRDVMYRPAVRIKRWGSMPVFGGLYIVFGRRKGITVSSIGRSEAQYVNVIFMHVEHF